MAKNKKDFQLKAKEVIGKKVLIIGEVGSGKTRLTAELLKGLLLIVDQKEITVIDMAPEKIGEIGGKLFSNIDSLGKLRYLLPEKIYAPRLMGTSRERVLEYVELNRKAISPLIYEFIKRPTKVLIINDITLYLHAGELSKILDCVRMAETFLASGYYGSKLKEDHNTGISNLERRMIERLEAYMDQVIKLGNLSFL